MGSVERSDAERRLLQSVLAGIEEGITVQEPGGRLLFANASAARLVGLDSPEAMLAEPMQELLARFRMFTEDGTPLAVEQLPGRAALAGRASEMVIQFLVVATGERRTTNVRAFPVVDADGKVACAVNIFRDVTDEHRDATQRRLLLRAVERFTASLDYGETLKAIAREMVPTLADWCAVDILEGGELRRLAVEHVDPAKVALVEEIERLHPRDPRSPGSPHGVIESRTPYFVPVITPEMVVAGAKDDEHRERIERLGLRSFLVVPMIGRTGPVGALTLATAESGRLYSVSDVGFANTLADRAATAVENARLALALERMVASERRAREIVERMESAIAAMSRATTRAEVAEAACRIGGEAMGAHAAHIWLEQADGSFALAATWPAGESLVEGFRTIAADADAPAARVARTGQAEWIESEEGFERAAPAIYPLVKAAGRMSAFGVLPIRTVRRFKGVLSVSHHLPHTYDADERAFYASLTEHCAQSLERARLFEEEQAARDVLEKAGRAKDEFLATISHELRTPLSSILGWTTLLRGRPRDEAKLEHGLEVIDRNARTQERLIGDLLDVARIVSGKLRLDLTRTALWEVVHAAAEIVRPAADGKGVRLSLDVDPDLPALVADPARLQQVVWNLLINAVRFTPPGGTVTVDARRTNSTILLHVRDTGSGIPPQHLPHLFEPFRQVDGSATRRHGGLGLGLAIVRHVVEAHGGSVEAHSDGAGRGATFTVALPVRAIDDSCGSERPEPPEERPPPVPRARLDGVRVLVVEDDADALDLIRNVLGDAGARVTAVASAAAALNADGPFDVIVSDIGMPEMDGYALMKRIRSRATGGDVPAIALTAFARPQDAERARRAGYQEHLHKPVEPGKLLATIANWRPARAAHRS